MTETITQSALLNKAPAIPLAHLYLSATPEGIEVTIQGEENELVLVDDQDEPVHFHSESAALFHMTRYDLHAVQAKIDRDTHTHYNRER